MGTTRMDKHGFYRLYRRKNASYKAWLWFSWIYIIMWVLTALVISTIGQSWFDQFYDSLTPETELGVSSAIIISAWLFLNAIVVLICLKVKVESRRRKLYDKFHKLSDEDKSEVNAELSPKFKHTLAGANRLYFYSCMFVHFVDYRDIIWVYRYKIGVPVGMISDSMVEMSTGYATGVVIWERDGTHYKIKTGFNEWDAAAIADAVKENAPSAIVGFNRK